jgi:hypothetical protein
MIPPSSMPANTVLSRLNEVAIMWTRLVRGAAGKLASGSEGSSRKDCSSRNVRPPSSERNIADGSVPT